MIAGIRAQQPLLDERCRKALEKGIVGAHGVIQERDSDRSKARRAKRDRLFETMGEVRSAVSHGGRSGSHVSRDAYTRDPMLMENHL